jgi:hypothetical protein
MPTRKLTALAAAAAALALPASAMAAPSSSGVVLSTGHHSLQVVNSAHVVSNYGYRGKLPKLHVGSRIAFAENGSTISDVRAAGSTNKVAYYANVVRQAGNHVVLRLADGNKLSVTTGNASGSSSKHHKVHNALSRSGSAVTLNLNLAPGTSVLVTEAIGADGAVTISITVEANGPADGGAGNGSGSGSGDGSGSGSGSDSGSGDDSSGGDTPIPANDKTASGFVTDVENTSFSIQTASGSTMTFQMDATDLSDVGMSPCDTVVVSYHPSGSQLDADNVNDNGTSNTGACASGGDGGSDETGPITAISATSVTIDTPDQGSMTFSVNPSLGLTEGYLLGDVVDVTYATNPNGSNAATDIEYVDNDNTGVVTAVSAGSVTITDDSTGVSETYTADPTQQMFQGVNVGDDIDVTWHQAASQMVADAVDDLTQDAGGN